MIGQMNCNGYVRAVLAGFLLFGLYLHNGTVFGDADSDDLSSYYGFGPMEILKIDYQISPPTVVDINHDGLNDLVFDNNRKSRIELLLQKKDFQPDAPVQVDQDSEDINEMFGREKTWRFHRAYLPVDVRVISFVAADLNDDALVDLAYYSNEGLFIVLQKSVEFAQDDSIREPKWHMPLKKDIREGLPQPDALARGDLNNDGKTDLALLGADTIFVFYQLPDGRLAEPLRLATAAGKVRQFYIADLDGDHRMDLILVTNDREYPIRVRLGDASGRLGPEITLETPLPRVVELSTFGRAGGKAMLATISELSGRILISGYEPGGSAEDQVPVYDYPLEKAESAKDRDYAVADMDGDGYDDIVVSDPDQACFLLFRGQGQAGLHRAQPFPGLKDMQKLCLARSDHGHEIIVLSPGEKIIGITRFQNGRLTFPSIIEVKGEPQAMDVADINGDGLDDLIYIAQDDPKKKQYSLRTIVGVTGNNAAAGPEFSLSQMKDRPKDLTVADIDHDGRADILIVPSYGSLGLVRQVEQDRFEEVMDTDIHSGLVSKIGPGEFVMASLGDRGTAAVLLAEKNYARSLYFDSTRGWQVIDQYPPAEPGSVLAAVAAAVLNNSDSPVSILTYDKTWKKLNILNPTPEGTYQTDCQIPVGEISVKRIFTGKFNDAVHSSIMIGGTHNIVMISMTGRSPVLQELTGFEPDIKDGQYGDLTVGDVNQDGFADVIVCEQAKNHIEILSFDAKGELKAGMKFKVFEAPRGAPEDRYDRLGDQNAGQPRRAVIGDVTGDGKNDLIVQVHDRIIIYPQD